jgi:beta-lactamase class A
MKSTPGSDLHSRPRPAGRQLLPRRIADKTGNNGSDAAGDIAVAWPKPDAAVLICAYTQGGSPTTAQLEAFFAKIGQMAGRQLV